jgi:hypothetical protein
VLKKMRTEAERDSEEADRARDDTFAAEFNPPDTPSARHAGGVGSVQLTRAEARPIGATDDSDGEEELVRLSDLPERFDLEGGIAALAYLEGLSQDFDLGEDVDALQMYLNSATRGRGQK